MISMARKKIDLEFVKRVVFSDLDKLLNSFNIDYSTSNGNYFSCCPVHCGSDNNQALSISVDKMAWRCWTNNCHEEFGRDIFGFTRGVLSNISGSDVTFSEALKYLCSLYKVSKTVDYEASQVDDNGSGDFKSIVRYFNRKSSESNLSEIPDLVTNEISEYFIKKRKFKPETIAHFGVRDCLKGKFARRSLIPVHDKDGVLLSYIARAIPKYLEPKFIWTNDFKKTNYLYNHHRAAEHIANKNELILVEGQGDVWRLHEAGIYNAVGLLGKEISSAQRDIMINLPITRLIVLMDDDQPGRESKFKIQRSFNRLFTLVFPKWDLSTDVGGMPVEYIQTVILPQFKRV